MVAREFESLFPDGKRMAYMRANDPDAGKYRLLTANLDGSDEKVLQIVDCHSMEASKRPSCLIPAPLSFRRLRAETAARFCWVGI